MTLDALAADVGRRYEPDIGEQRIREMLMAELERGRDDDRFPLAPARIVADTRAALGRNDIALVDKLRREHNADGVILGGTELPLLLGGTEIAGLPALDTTELHVAAIVARLEN